MTGSPRRIPTCREQAGFWEGRRGCVMIAAWLAALFVARFVFDHMPALFPEFCEVFYYPLNELMETFS